MHQVTETSWNISQYHFVWSLLVGAKCVHPRAACMRQGTSGQRGRHLSRSFFQFWCYSSGFGSSFSEGSRSCLCNLLTSLCLYWQYNRSLRQEMQWKMQSAGVLTIGQQLVLDPVQPQGSFGAPVKEPSWQVVWKPRYSKDSVELLQLNLWGWVIRDQWIYSPLVLTAKYAPLVAFH